MFGTLRTLFRAVEAEAEEALIDANDTRLMAQHLRDAKADTMTARRTVAALLAREKAECRRIDALTTEIAQREEETRAAMEAEDEGLANVLADRIASLEDQRAAAIRARDELTTRSGRLRENLSQADRRIAALASELRAARAGKACRSAQMSLGEGLGPSALERAEALSWRVRETGERLEDEMAAAAEMHMTEADDLNARMREAGLADPDTKRRDAILARLKKTD
ncbi:MAG: PspA/IM30 family protein [Pseudomonadota bacterium]